MFHSRNYLIPFLVFCCMTANRLTAQDTLTASSVETVSYKYYLSSDWDELSSYCEKAIHAGFDYYYLRIRAGIAYYEMDQYRKAIPHFQKALEFNTGDPLANSYLYGSYLRSAQYEEARQLSRSFDSSFAAEMKTDQQSPVGFVAADGAYKLSSKPSYIQNGTLAQLSLSQYVKNRFSILHAVNFYSQDEYRNKITQFQYYLRPTIPLKNNYSISAGIHLVGEKIDRHPPPPPPGKPAIPGITDYLFGVVGSASITKHRAYFDYTFGLTAAALDSVRQLQPSVSMNYFPFCNNWISVQANLYAHTENNFQKTSFAFSPGLTAVIRPRLIVTAVYFTNPEGNISEYTGLLVNNSQDISMSRYTVNVSAGITKQLFLNAGYCRENKFDNQRAGRYYYDVMLFGIRYVPAVKTEQN